MCWLLTEERLKLFQSGAPVNFLPGSNFFPSTWFSFVPWTSEFLFVLLSDWFIKAHCFLKFETKFATKYTHYYTFVRSFIHSLSLCIIFLFKFQLTALHSMQINVELCTFKQQTKTKKLKNLYCYATRQKHQPHSLNKSAYALTNRFPSSSLLLPKCGCWWQNKMKQKSAFLF